VANPKLSSLQDPFTATTINTAQWNNITTGTAALDTVNDVVSVAIPTTATTNTFGTNLLYDATGSYVYAQIGAPGYGAGTTGTILRVRFDTNNNVAIRLDGALFRLRMIDAGVTTTVTIAAEYDPHAHRWWRLRESGGSFYADTSPDGLTWTEQTSLPYTWTVGAASVTVRFEAVAGTTEPAGNVIQVSHVNTRAGGPYNPNWPMIEDGWGTFWNANGGAQPMNRYIDITDRTRGTVSVQRGRQYETDQVRSGEASLRLANTDAALDPVNTSSPFAGHITPYQPYRRRAQWPPTRNLLDQVAATGGDLGGFTGTINSATTDIFSEGTGGTFAATTTAWQGDTVIQYNAASGMTAGQRMVYTLRWSVAPGQTYTTQIRVRNINDATTVDLKAFLGWYTYGTLTPTSYDYGTNSVITGSSTFAGWTTLTVTATAPANAVGMVMGAALNSPTTSSLTMQFDGWQLEKGAAATAWTCPGVWSPVYAGFTERWPSTWDMEGLYGVVEPTAVDSFSLLSQQQLNDALTMELNANNPRFVYKLDDPAGSTTLADWAGNQAPIQIGIGKYGAGSITFGAAVAANDPIDGIYTGSTDTVATISNSNPGTNLVSGGASFLKLSSAGIVGPADLSQWTRMFAFRYTGPTPTVMSVLWSSFSHTRTDGNPSGSMMYWKITNTGLLQLIMGGPASGAGTVYQPSATSVVSDGNWHLVTCTYSRANGQLIMMLDGVAGVWNVGTDKEPAGLVSDNIGTWVDPTVGNGTTYNFKGNMSFIAEFPTALSVNAQGNIHQAWKNACAGEPSSSRYSRILRYAKYTGATKIQSGLTTSMGPAVIDGQDAMSALQAVVDTENGAHYVDAAGTINFRSRSSRYNALTPMYVFGERVDLGEWPYEDCQLDFDSTHLSNQVTVTQEGTSQQFYAVDAASVTGYFPRTMTRTINANNTDECQDAANYLLSRYRQPATRVSSLKLHPSANPALWPVCLALDLGTRIRVMRRPPGAPAVQVECFVENISWEFGDDGEAWLTLQCSPADLTSYGVIGAWHTSLAASSAVGATSLTLNAPQVTQVYSQTFATAGTWRTLSGSGTDGGPITVASDAGTTAAMATAASILEDLTEIPYDPTLTYRVSATLRTATPPTAGSPLVYVGLTGITADGKRCNINGANTISSQHYAAARAVQPPSTYTTYTGYVSGTATPSDGGANTDPANPMRVRPEVVRVRPIVYMLNSATGGVQYMDSFTIHTVPALGGVPAASQIAPGQQLVLGQGTANAETVTVSAVGATSPGWMTGTVTLTAPATKAHTAGDVVCEPLPTGTTDPATWDTVDKFDSVAFAY
jgi:hypothetical protein